MILKMLADPETKSTFLRYCTKEEKISKEMEKKVNDYIEEKIKKRKEEEKNNKSNNYQKLNSVGDSRAESEFKESPRLLNFLEKDRMKEENFSIPSVFSSEIDDSERMKLLKEYIEKVSPHKDYQGPTSILGINRKKNISLRLKEGKNYYSKKK